MEERGATRFVSPFDRALVHAGLDDHEAALSIGIPLKTIWVVV